MTGDELGEEFFRGRGVDIAKELLGKLLVNGENGSGGIIVETEAYLGKQDPSCHFAKSGEARKRVFRKGAGTVYVYKIHGHDCMNFISEFEGYPEGVLIRALEPTREVDSIRSRRGGRSDRELLSGPGKLTEGLDIKKARHNGQHISESPVTVQETGREPEVEVGKRIGISEAEDWPCRFAVRDSDFLSKPVVEADRSFDTDRFYRGLDRSL